MENFDEIMNEAVVDETIDETTNEAAVDEKKLAKVEAAQRFKERKAAEAAERKAAMTLHKQQLIDAGMWDELDDSIKAAIDSFICPKSGAGNGVFGVIFPAAKVGDEVTLKTIFEKTLKGKQTIDLLVKKWAKNGVIVEFVADEEDMLNSKYIIRAM